MATGPEHYREAERLDAEAGERIASGGWSAATALAARAQVHATLANAAALVDATNEELSDLTAWREAQDGVLAATLQRRPTLEDYDAQADPLGVPTSAY
jgi:hypothetical protein